MLCTTTLSSAVFILFVLWRKLDKLVAYSMSKKCNVTEFDGEIVDFNTKAVSSFHERRTKVTKIIYVDLLSSAVVQRTALAYLTDEDILL